MRLSGNEGSDSGESESGGNGRGEAGGDEAVIAAENVSRHRSPFERRIP